MTKRERQELADRLRQAIKDSGMSQYRLSRESGVSTPQLSRFMRGERDLSLTVAEKLCRVLGLNLFSEARKK